MDFNISKIHIGFFGENSSPTYISLREQPKLFLLNDNVGNNFYIGNGKDPEEVFIAHEYVGRLPKFLYIKGLFSELEGKIVKNIFTYNLQPRNLCVGLKFVLIDLSEYYFFMSQDTESITLSFLAPSFIVRNTRVKENALLVMQDTYNIN